MRHDNERSQLRISRGDEEGPFRIVPVRGGMVEAAREKRLEDGRQELREALLVTPGRSENYQPSQGPLARVPVGNLPDELRRRTEAPARG